MAEREADLARVEAQVKSLRQVEAEQQNIIDKLAVKAQMVRCRSRARRTGLFASAALGGVSLSSRLSASPKDQSVGGVWGPWGERPRVADMVVAASHNSVQNSNSEA